MSDSLPSTSQVDIGADNADMIESMRIGCERRHALKADDGVVGSANGDVKDILQGKPCNVRRLGLNAKRRIEQRIRSRFDDRVEYGHDRSSIVGLRVSNQKFHRDAP